MTSRRDMRSSSSDDAARAAVAPLLDGLRSELLVMPSEAVVADHLDMMVFERQILATPRPARTVRSPFVRPRRGVFVAACVAATIASCGLSAAGALPEPLQHITDSIARTLGVPKPSDAPQTSRSGAIGLHPGGTRPDPHRSSASASGPAPTSSLHASAKPAAPVRTHAESGAPVHVTTPKGHTPTPPPYIPARPTKPSKRVEPKPAGPPPSNDSHNTPPGYPTGWRKLAIAATAAHLQACTQVSSLVPPGCPQAATVPGDLHAQSVQWSLLNQPERGAVAIAQTRRTDRNGKTVATTTVTVYERFQMEASYTDASASRLYLAYSGGIAQATMTWSGSSFSNVTFAAGSAAGHLLPGVSVASFGHPAAAPDRAVLGAVLAGFNDCAALMAPATAPTPNCAPDGASKQWTLVGDPTRGADVTFDRQAGDFTVTGTYTMTGTDATGTGTTVSGRYTATLFFDAQQMQLLSISAG